MTLYETAIQQFANIGVFSIFIPFILIYSLIFLLLESSGLLTKDNNDKTGKKLHALFSFGFALMAIAHQELIKWLLFLIPNATVFILALFLFAVAMALLVMPSKMQGYMKGFIYLIALLVIIILAAEGVGVSGSPVSDIVTALHGVLTDLIGIVVIIIMFFVLLWWIGKGGENQIPKIP